MNRETIEFDAAVPEALADELAKRVFYVSDQIVDFTLVRSERGVTGIEVVTTATDPGLGRKLGHVVANDVLPQLLTEPKELWRSPLAAGLHPDVYGELVERGAVYEAAEGQIALGEPLLGLMDYLDRRVREIARRDFGAVEYRYPTLLPVAALGRCGYLGSFPQQLMFVTRVHADLDAYRAFVDDLGPAGVPDDLLSHCRNADYLLPPTMCLHTYNQLRDAPLPAESLVVTSRGKSFRFESRYRRALERLWDFTIREIVFLGSKAFVVDCRDRFIEASTALVEELGLTGHCTVANDPFFSERSAEQSWSQRMLELKYELRLNIDAATTIAAASFNFHERFFGDAFGIAAPGAGHIHTGCVGFGLERLTYAFLCHHGPDPAGWPDGARAG